MITKLDPTRRKFFVIPKEWNGSWAQEQMGSGQSSGAATLSLRPPSRFIPRLDVGHCPRAMNSTITVSVVRFSRDALSATVATLSRFRMAMAVFLTLRSRIWRLDVKTATVRAHRMCGRCKKLDQV